MRGGKSPRAAGLEGLGAGRRRSWSCSASSSSACSPTAPTRPSRRCPQRVVDPAGQALYTERDVQRGPAGLPAQRPHGVRLGLRPRRLPRPGLHGRLPAPRRRTSSRAATAAPAPTAPRAAPSRTSAPTATTSATGTLALTAPQAEAHRRLVGHYTRFFSEPTTKHGLRPEAITDRERARRSSPPSSAGRRGRRRRAARPQLLLHEQLAARAARRQRADGQRDRLERAVADRAARRHRDPVRRLRALALPRLARARAGHAVVPHARRRRAHARAARVRVVLLRDGGAVPDPDVRRRRVPALPRRAGQLLRLRPRRRSSRTT